MSAAADAGAKHYLFADLPVSLRPAVAEHLRSRLATDFGIEYNFFLSESIDAKEFVLPWRSFCAVAAPLGLKLVLSMTFPEFLRMAAVDAATKADLARWIGRLNASNRLDKPQFEVFALYKVFVFKKVVHPGAEDSSTSVSTPGQPAERGGSSEGEARENATDSRDGSSGERTGTKRGLRSAFLEGVSLKRQRGRVVLEESL